MNEQGSTLMLTDSDIGAERRTKEIASIMLGVSKRPGVIEAKRVRDELTARHEHVLARIGDVRSLITSTFAALSTARAEFEDSLCGDGALPSDAASIAGPSAFSLELTRSLQTLSTDRLPRCEVRKLLADAEFFAVFSRELSDAASAKLTETIKLSGPALLAEGGINFDPTKTASGAQQEQARLLLENSEALRTEALDVMQKFNIAPTERLN